MNGLWEYQPTNLLALRAMQRTDGTASREEASYNHHASIFQYCATGNKISSMFVPNIWPKSGYIKAHCFPVSRQWTAFRAGTNTKHNFHKDCVCGVYGLLSLQRTREKGQGKYPICTLIEAHGEIVVGNRGIIRAEGAQVVAVVNDNGWPFITLAHNTFASSYFDVPIIESDQAEEMVNKQMEKWGLKIINY